jgi:hypothetical protein
MQHSLCLTYSKRSYFAAGGGPVIVRYRTNYEYNQYIDGKKYCRRCETYFYHNGLFCPCCGMQLRRTLSTRSGKERLRRRAYMNRTLKGPSSKIISLKTIVSSSPRSTLKMYKELLQRHGSILHVRCFTNQ